MLEAFGFLLMFSFLPVATEIAIEAASLSFPSSLPGEEHSLISVKSPLE
jgi:hypothetical protein